MHPWTGSAPTLFVDSNVINEYMTAVDVDRAVSSSAHTRGLISPEPRRLRTRGTMWFAMVLDAEQRVTICLQDEPLRFAAALAPPGTAGGAWVAAMVHFVGDFVTPGWGRAALAQDAGSNRRNDTLIAEDAVARGIAVVTRDAGVVSKVRFRGGIAMSPEEYVASANVLTLAQARSRFFERFDAHSMTWAASCCHASGTRWLRQMERQCEGVAIARNSFEYIWSEHPDEWEVDARP